MLAFALRMTARKSLAVGLAWTVSAASASRANEPDLLAQARYACDRCIEQMPRYLETCAGPAGDRPKFGDVIVRLHHQAGTGADNPVFAKGTVTASPTDGLGTSVGRCVEERLRQLDCLSPCYVDLSFPIDIALGDTKPLLPDVSELVPHWRAYKDSTWLTRWWRRRRFSRTLPADVRLTPDGCLWLPQADNLRAGLDAWQKRLGHEIAASALRRFARPPTGGHWEPSWDRGYQISAEEAILVDYGPVIDDHRDWHEYDGSAGIRVCLVPLSGTS
jgi:hypothetical protein